MSGSARRCFFKKIDVMRLGAMCILSGLFHITGACGYKAVHVGEAMSVD